jgi:hypothetical protein
MWSTFGASRLRAFFQPAKQNRNGIGAFVGLAVSMVPNHGFGAGGWRLDADAAEVSGRCGVLERN